MSNVRPEGRTLGSNRDDPEESRDTSPAAQPATHRKTDRRRASTRPTLPEPVIVAEFWANRRGESVRVQLREFEGCPLVDVRKHFTNGEGKLQATKRGIALAVARLPDLADAINKALRKAAELGLVDVGPVP
jgi:hypothetical protein